MKVGETVQVQTTKLLEPLVDRLAYVTFAGETEQTLVRIISIDDAVATIKVVPKSTKE